MIKLDNKGYQQLKEHENVLAAAYKGDYMNCPYVTAKEILDIAIRCGYNGKTTLNCTRCRMNILKEVGKAYFEYKQKLADSAAKAREAKAAKKTENGNE